MNSPRPWIEKNEKGILLHVIVVPGSSRSDVTGLHDQRLKVTIKSPPTQGKANRELINFLSKTMRVTKNSLAIIRGQNNRRKSILNTTLAHHEAVEILQPLLKP